VAERRQAARWFVEAIERRRQTIRRVVEAVVRVQRDFFDRGPGHLRPLALREVAEEIAMHESTVSRAISAKYVPYSAWRVPPQALLPAGGGGRDGRPGCHGGREGVSAGPDRRRRWSPSALRPGPRLN